MHAVSRTAVARLQQPLRITSYVSPRPAGSPAESTTIADALAWYSSAASEIRTESVTPTAPAFDGVPPECTRSEYRPVDAASSVPIPLVRCLRLEYAGRTTFVRDVPLVVTARDLEYDITSAIIDLLRGRPIAIGFLDGHGELTPAHGLEFLSQLADAAHVAVQTRSVDLGAGAPTVPADIDGLVVVAPTRALSEPELRALDGYLMHGGRIAVVAGGLTLTTAGPTNANGALALHGLNGWLGGYGFTLEPNVVLDTRSAEGVVRVGNNTVRLQLVTWPRIDLLSEPGSTATALTHDVSEFWAPYPSTITVDASRVRAGGGTMTAFARTSARSVVRRTGFDLDAVDLVTNGQRVFASPDGSQTIGVTLEGSFASAYGSARASRPGRLAVLASSHTFDLETFRVLVQMGAVTRPGNITLMFNLFAWLAAPDDLLPLRNEAAR